MGNCEPASLSGRESLGELRVQDPVGTGILDTLSRKYSRGELRVQDPVDLALKE